MERYEEVKEGKKKTRRAKPFKEVMHHILTTETTLNVAHRQILPIHESTRHALDYLLTELAGEHGKVALPLPNWNFWEFLDGAKAGQYSFSYFNALTQDQLIEGFKSAAKKQDIKAIIIVDPTNPLGYRITEACAKEVETIAQKYNIKIVVDDVLRGNKPMGERDTIARHFSEPYVVEGFSHRFGVEPIGDISYILTPKNGAKIKPQKQENCVCSELLQAAYTYTSAVIIEELEARNRAFDEGIRVVCPDVRIERPSTGSITSVLYLPEGFPLEAKNFRTDAYYNGVKVDSLDSFYPKGYQIPNELPQALRIAIGTMDQPEIKTGAAFLGRGLLTNQEQRRK